LVVVTANNTDYGSGIVQHFLHEVLEYLSLNTPPLSPNPEILKIFFDFGKGAVGNEEWQDEVSPEGERVLGIARSAIHKTHLAKHVERFWE